MVSNKYFLFCKPEFNTQDKEKNNIRVNHRVAETDLYPTCPACFCWISAKSSMEATCRNLAKKNLVNSEFNTKWPPPKDHGRILAVSLMDYRCVCQVYRLNHSEIFDF